MKKVCNDVEIESKLVSLTVQQLQYRSGTAGDETRLDICVRSFWVRGQESFLDIRVFDQTVTDTSMPYYHNAIK